MTSKSAKIYQPVWVSIGTGGYICSTKEPVQERIYLQLGGMHLKNARVLGTKFPREGGILVHQVGPASPDQVAKEQRNRWMELTIGKR